MCLQVLKHITTSSSTPTLQKKASMRFVSRLMIIIAPIQISFDEIYKQCGTLVRALGIILHILAILSHSAIWRFINELIRAQYSSYYL
ncbi:unnamed protein product [Moneuplotes crassus]|uniref:Uncharacterized protein n=1 Tax=Euplotes crassus TaxID=5936 RepID=A0AAD1XYT2_EUPCR|nr:unnamed protein product [Moneuplotes crassus]